MKLRANDILVMYLGQAVEKTPAEELFENPMHPYTKALLSVVLIPEIGANNVRIQLRGELTSPINTPDECRFAKQCNYHCEQCNKGIPPLLEVSPNHFVACHQVGSVNKLCRLKKTLRPHGSTFYPKAGFNRFRWR